MNIKPSAKAVSLGSIRRATQAGDITGTPEFSNPMLLVRQG